MLTGPQRLRWLTASRRRQRAPIVIGRRGVGNDDQPDRRSVRQRPFPRRCPLEAGDKRQYRAPPGPADPGPRFPC